MAGSKSGLITIAQKEFFDHIRSKKFLLIFSIFLVIALVGMIGGISEYNKDIKSYNERITDTTSMIAPAYIGEKPSVMTVFYSVAFYLMSLGAILGIAMGFDLITKEKESKSLKILLSHPIFRDEVINGKALGGIAALCSALLLVLVLSLATLLIFGIVPDANELVLIAVFGFVSFLLIFTYFAISLFMSTACSDSGSSMIFTMIIFIVLSSLLPVMASGPIMESVIGSPPEMNQELIDRMQSSMSLENGTVSSIVPVSDDSNTAWEEYSMQQSSYWDKWNAAEDIISLFSPTMNYEKITGAITRPQSGISFRMGETSSATLSPANTFETTDHHSMSVTDILGGLVSNIIALLVFPAGFFALAYIRFMRMDVR